jgi:hypothetical protein
MASPPPASVEDGRTGRQLEILSRALSAAHFRFVLQECRIALQAWNADRA